MPTKLTSCSVVAALFGVREAQILRITGFLPLVPRPLIFRPRLVLVAVLRRLRATALLLEAQALAPAGDPHPADDARRGPHDGLVPGVRHAEPGARAHALTFGGA